MLAQPRVVLLGDPGAGKSTALRYIAFAVASRMDTHISEAALGRLPILVRLVEYVRERNKTPRLRLRDYVRDLHDGDRRDLFKHALEAGECLVMLDGLDEVIDAADRREIAGQVEALVADCPGNHFLVTSRIVGYEAGRLTGDFAHFTLGPLPEESITTFIQNWYEAIERAGDPENGALARDSAEDLCDAIKGQPGIRRLAENPLLLTIIALVNWKAGRLPNRRIEVYRHASETLIESWPRTRRGVAFDLNEILGLLAPVAYRIFCDRSSDYILESELVPLLVDSMLETKSGMPRDEAESYIEDNLLPKVSEQSGLFLERGIDAETNQRVFGFLHLTFAEYLSARFLATRWEEKQDDTERRAFLARYAHVPRWREVFLLMAGHIGLDGRRRAATQLISDILWMGSPYEEHLHRDLLLAGQCLADDLRVDAPASNWVLDQLTRLLVETPVSALQTEVVQQGKAMASTSYNEEYIDRLLQLLGDEDSHARDLIAWTLGEIETRPAVDSLLELLGDEDSQVRSDTAKALGKIGSERAVGGLLALLDDDDSYVRELTIWALGEINSEQAVDALLQIVGDVNSTDRHHAAIALRKTKSERAVDELLRQIRDEPLIVRNLAAQALGMIKSARAIGGLLALLGNEIADVRDRAIRALDLGRSPEIWEAFPSRYRDFSSMFGDSATGKQATWVLGNTEAEQAIDYLIDLLDANLPDVRARAAWALGKIETERAVDHLLELLNDEDLDVRYNAVEALKQIGSERAVDGLLTLLGDEEPDVRSKAAEALGWMDAEQAVDGLLALLSDEDWDVRYEAANALGEIKSERAIDGLLTLLDDTDCIMRGCAACALGEMEAERASERLLALLNDEDSWVRSHATKALGRIGSEQAVDSLLALLNDEDRDVRSRATEALGKIGTERAIDGLLALLNENDWLTRIRVVEALRTGQSEQAVDGLLELLNDENSSVSDRAAGVLGKIKSERMIDGLLALLDNERSDVRVQAIRLLGIIKSERAVDCLLKLLGDKDSHIRDLAAWSLGRIKSERAVDHLLGLLTATSSDLRGSAAKALGEIGSERAIDSLLTLLYDSSSDVCYHAAQALKETNQERAANGLLELLDDSDYKPDFDFWRACSWAYSPIQVILENRINDPGEDIELLRQKSDIVGPWTVPTTG